MICYFSCLWRLVRNLVIAIASALWLIPLWLYSNNLIRWMATIEERLPEGGDMPVNYLPWPGLFSISHFAACEISLRYWVMILGIIITFWTFVIANKLWPIRKNRVNNMDSSHLNSMSPSSCFCTIHAEYRFGGASITA